MSGVLEELVRMSRSLADPANDYVILGEGNTSAAAEGGTFWVKASGTQLAEAQRDSFARVTSAPVLESLGGPDMSDAEIKELLVSARVEGTKSPSIETFLHALCLDLDGVSFVGHTHPTAALRLLSGHQSRELFSGCLYPDQIVVLGPTYVYVPYTDPGLPLARAMAQALDEYAQREGRVPKLVLMENHGVIALGSNAREVMNITAMCVKLCRVICGALVAGGPRYLSQAHVERIDTRPDEEARRRELK